FARRLWGDAEAWLAFIATLASPLSVAFSRTVIFDGALAFFIAVAMMGFYLAVEEGAEGRAQGAGGGLATAPPAPRPLRPAPSIVAWIAVGLGVITKGPVAIALPLLVAVPYAIVRKRVGAVFPLLGLVLFAAVIAPWVWAISRAVPDFLNYVLVVETTQRLTTGALKRTGPPWYFIPYLLGGAVPWTFVLFGQKLDRRDRGILYLLLWIAIPFLFFSLSQSKRPQYILPLVPAVALLVARVWCEARRGTRIAAALLILLGGATIAALRFVHLRDEFAVGARATAISFGLCALVGGVIAFAFTNRRWISFIALSLPVLAIPLCANPLMNGLALRRSTKELMSKIPPNAEVVGVEAFTGSMAFYLQRPIVVVTPDAEEFRSNYLIRHYDRFAGSATLRRPSDLDALLADRVAPRLFIVREGDGANRAKLAARGLRLLAEGAHYDVYRMP
ncbi:MAG TPA: hypothetical protein VEO74_11125, partial [Thermoanaerobaculia bacterium]|nr:hypothetical protein [Thermoanaerobaculia bacterium]